MESNLLLEQYSWYKKQQLAKAPFECLLNADIEPSLKHKLMLQSLSPLAFLTIVRNFKFTPVSELAENQSYWGEFVRLNNVLIVVFLLCATWILAAIISFISFTAFRWTDKKQRLLFGTLSSIGRC